MWGLRLATTVALAETPQVPPNEAGVTDRPCLGGQDVRLPLPTSETRVEALAGTQGAALLDMVVRTVPQEAEARPQVDVVENVPTVPVPPRRRVPTGRPTLPAYAASLGP